MSLDRFSDSPIVREFLALDGEQQRRVHILVAARIDAGPVHDEALHGNARRAEGLRLIHQGYTQAEVARRLGVHGSTVRWWIDHAGDSRSDTASHYLRGLRAQAAEQEAR